MKIYNVLWKGRRSDTTAKPFTDLSKAIEYARKSAKSVCRSPEDYSEYSCEGDCLWITEHELDLQETP